MSTPWAVAGKTSPPASENNAWRGHPVPMPVFEGYGLQPVRKPRKINGALAPDGSGWFGFTFAGAEDGFNH